MLVVPVLLAVAFTTVFERKVLGGIQKRRGPTSVGVLGLGQALADGLKLMIKETIIPSHSNKILFILAPLVVFTLSLLG